MLCDDGKNREEGGREEKAVCIADQSATVIPKSGTESSTVSGLARMGSRAALSFAFAFLRRAWRSGKKGALCRRFFDTPKDTRH